MPSLRMRKDCAGWWRMLAGDLAERVHDVGTQRRVGVVDELDRAVDGAGPPLLQQLAEDLHEQLGILARHHRGEQAVEVVVVLDLAADELEDAGGSAVAQLRLGDDQRFVARGHEPEQQVDGDGLRVGELPDPGQRGGHGRPGGLAEIDDGVDELVAVLAGLGAQQLGHAGGGLSADLGAALLLFGAELGLGGRGGLGGGLAVAGAVGRLGRRGFGLGGRLRGDGGGGRRVAGDERQREHGRQGLGGVRHCAVSEHIRCEWPQGTTDNPLAQIGGGRLV